MITTRAPGKLFIAGEYAVIEPGRAAVVVAVDRYMTVSVSDCQTGGVVTLATDHAGGAVLFCNRVRGQLEPIAPYNPGFEFVLAAIRVVESLATVRGVRLRLFRLTVTSGLAETDGRKFGLGSSAAVTVAVVDAMCRFYALDIDPMRRYRLAMLATIGVHSQASGGDVAASAFGGWIHYRSPDREFVAALVLRDGIEATLTAPWPGLRIEVLPQPSDMQLHVGWTGTAASTPELVARRIEDDNRTDRYRAFLDASDDCVERLAQALSDNDVPASQSQIHRAYRLLTDFDAMACVGIMTPKLRELCAQAVAVGGAAKPSGAGGGDCGIALLGVQSGSAADELDHRWRRAEIVPLSLRIHPTMRGGTDDR